MAYGGAGTPALPWQEFLRRNGPLMTDARGLLARHYSEERLTAPAARECFLPPDRLPLPPCGD